MEFKSSRSDTLFICLRGGGGRTPPPACGRSPSPWQGRFLGRRTLALFGGPPHPPQCAHWGTFPSRGRLCGCLRSGGGGLGSGRPTHIWRDCAVGGRPMAAPTVGCLRGGGRTPPPACGRSPSPWQGRFFGRPMAAPTETGMRIATPVCALARNDRSGGASEAGADPSTAA